VNRTLFIVRQLISVRIIDLSLDVLFITVEHLNFVQHAFSYCNGALIVF